MGEAIGNNKIKEEKLREIVRDLNEGTDIRKVKKQFDKLIRDISPEEIANVEQSLINEGVPVEHVQKLCDIHVQVFDDALKKQGKSKVLPGHPVHTYRLENKELKKKLRGLKQSIKSDFLSRLKDVKMIELHYIRKENQLFPFLETVGFTGPSKVMWGKHDEIRALFRKLEEDYNKGDLSAVKSQTGALIKALKNMIFMEEKILFPTSIRKLPPQAWSAIRKGETAIGYCWIEPGNLWDANIVGSTSSEPASVQTSAKSQAGDEKISLDTGALSAAQINLLLKNLPFDMTYVDENDKVAYYSEGKERIFPRSPGIIGREVANCHPPKSVHVVEKIVEALKNGEKDQAEFWIKMNGMFIHIRYFPIFDEQGKYRGIIEVSQEVSGIRALEGERRLLDW
jgi:hypothetical protein